MSCYFCQKCRRLIKPFKTHCNIGLTGIPLQFNPRLIYEMFSNDSEMGDGYATSQNGLDRPGEVDIKLNVFEVYDLTSVIKNPVYKNIMDILVATKFSALCEEDLLVLLQICKRSEVNNVFGQDSDDESMDTHDTYAGNSVQRMARWVENLPSDYGDSDEDFYDSEDGSITSSSASE